METRQKVFAYITRGDELLIFRHVYHPDAGLQVPAGTLQDGEAPEDGVLREALEETGIRDLRIEALLGEHVRDMRDFGTEAWHHRHFFHLTSDVPLPDTWRNAQPEGDAPFDGKPIQFDFFWAPLDAVPTLLADHDRFLPALRHRLQGSQ